MNDADAKTWKRRLLFIGLAAIAIVAVGFALRPAPVAVDFGEVTRGSFTVTIDEEGETRVRETYIVSAPVGGRTTRVTLHVGDPVVGGETVVAGIVPSDPAFLDIRTHSEAEAQAMAAEAALKLAEADLERALADRDLAKAELERIEKLLKSRTVSQAAYDRADATFRRARAAVQTAQASIDVARFKLESAKAALLGPAESPDTRCCQVDVRAPVSGRVLRVIQESETVIGPGMPILEVGDPADLEIVVDLLSSDAVRAKEGAAVLIDGWGGDKVMGLSGASSLSALPKCPHWAYPSSGSMS